MSKHNFQWQRFNRFTYAQPIQAPHKIAGWSETGDTFVVKDLEEFANLVSGPRTVATVQLLKIFLQQTEFEVSESGSGRL